MPGVALALDAALVREGQIRSVPGAALPLTVAALAVVHRDRFGRDFITDGAAGAAAGVSFAHLFSPDMWLAVVRCSYSRLSSFISFGAGAPFPVSRSDFRPIRSWALPGAEI